MIYKGYHFNTAYYIFLPFLPTNLQESIDLQNTRANSFLLAHFSNSFNKISTQKLNLPRLMKHKILMIDHLVYLVVQHLQIDELLFEYFYEALLPERVELRVNNINDKRVGESRLNHVPSKPTVSSTYFINGLVIVAPQNDN
jgi:hypothetical protein